MTDPNPQYLYFSYGSNMSREKLTTRGDPDTPPIAFTDLWVAKVENWALCFNIQAAPPYEPAMGSIHPSPNSHVYGLVYSLDSERSWRKLLESEGIRSDFRNPTAAYHVITLTAQCHRADAADEISSMQVKTLMTNPRRAIPAYLQPFIRPSRRYMKLLIDGARRERLPDGYVGMLEAVAVARRWRMSVLVWMMIVVLPLQFRVRVWGLTDVFKPYFFTVIHLYAWHERAFMGGRTVWKRGLLYFCRLGLFFTYAVMMVPAVLLLAFNARSRKSYRMMKNIVMERGEEKKKKE